MHWTNLLWCDFGVLGAILWWPSPFDKAFGKTNLNFLCNSLHNVCVHTSLFDQLMESPRKHIFNPQMVVSQVFQLLLLILLRGPLTSRSRSSAYFKERCVFIVPIVHRRRTKSFGGQPCKFAQNTYPCGKVITCKSRPVKSHSFKGRWSPLGKNLGIEMSIHRHERSSSFDKETFIRWFS